MEILKEALIAVAVVGAVSLVLGILLALFIRFFGIEEDKKVKEIRSCLPGINCGACGFKGCDDYAAALAAYGATNGIPVADCNTLSHLEASAGKHYSEIVTTGVNHPGAYGHRLYFYAIKSLFDME